MTLDSQHPIQLTGRQRLVFELVSERSPEIAGLYEHGLRALEDGVSSGRFYPAAHAIRLFMHDLPKIFELPTLGSLPQLSNRVRKLDNPWNAACASQSRTNGVWKGDIDEPLEKLLTALEEFFAWRQDQPQKEQIAARFFTRSDPGPVTLPADLPQRRAKQWLKLYGYFNAVAHLSSTTLPDFQERLTDLEGIVQSCLYREPSASFDAIDAILAEEVPDA